MRKLSKIILIFENCDFVTIDCNYIYNISIGDIKSNLRFSSNNYIIRSNITNYLSLELKDIFDYEYTTVFGDKRSLLKQLNCNDITSIDIFSYEEDTPNKIECENIVVRWYFPKFYYSNKLIRYILNKISKRNWMYTNKYQKHKIRILRNKDKIYKITIKE